jgi:DNA-binding transcriptional LysR family regulator
VVRTALDQLEQGYGRLLDQARGPTLHVACSATFAMRWLVPELVDSIGCGPISVFGSR